MTNGNITNMIVDNKILLDPNFLIDILIKIILISSFFYILYKFFLVEITVDYLINQVFNHINIYIAELKKYIQENYNMDDIITDLNKNIDSLPSTTANTYINDTNFAIIYSTIIGTIAIIIGSLIFINNSFRIVKIENVLFSLFINLIVIIVSQLLFFYFVYSYLDPIKLFKILYYKYVIQKDKSKTTTTTTKSNIINTGDNTILLSSNNVIVIYIFLIIFIISFILSFIMLILNILSNKYNYDLSNIILPLNNISIYIYSILSLVFLFLSIIMLLLFMNRI